MTTTQARLPKQYSMRFPPTIIHPDGNRCFPSRTTISQGLAHSLNYTFLWISRHNKSTNLIAMGKTEGGGRWQKSLKRNYCYEQIMDLLRKAPTSLHFRRASKRNLSTSGKCPLECQNLIVTMDTRTHFLTRQPSLPNSRFTGVFGRGMFLETFGQPDRRRWVANRPLTWPEPSHPSVGQLNQRQKINK